MISKPQPPSSIYFGSILSFKYQLQSRHRLPIMPYLIKRKITLGQHLVKDYLVWNHFLDALQVGWGGASRHEMLVRLALQGFVLNLKIRISL